MREMVLHIGAAKTGSTSLQKFVFQAVPDLHHFGEVGDGTTETSEERILWSLYGDDDSFYNADMARTLFSNHQGLADGRNLVFSSADVLARGTPSRTASRLRAIVGQDAQVLLVVRNQVTALSSFYAGHGAWLKPAPKPFFRRYVSPRSWMEFQWEVESDSVLRQFLYWECLQPFVGHFGASNCHVVTFEGLVGGDLQSWTTISRLLGCGPEECFRAFSSGQERNRITRGQMALGRLMGALDPWHSPPDVRSLKWASLGGMYTPNWPSGEIERLSAYFGPGNRELSKETGLDLAQFSYPGVA